MYDKGIMYCDFKLDNIFYKKFMVIGFLFIFVIFDFGFVIFVMNIRDVGGIFVCFGFEVIWDGIMIRVIDVYVFGFMLLEVFGWYCFDEGDVVYIKIVVWRKKLEINVKFESLREKCRRY